MLSLDFPGARKLIEAIDAAVQLPDETATTDALRSLLCAIDSSIVFAMKTVQVMSEAKASPIMTTLTMMSAARNIDQGDNSCGTTKADFSDPPVLSAEGVVASPADGVACPPCDGAEADAGCSAAAG